MVRRPLGAPFIDTQQAWNSALSVVAWLVEGKVPPAITAEDRWDVLKNIALRHRVAGRLVESTLAEGTADTYRITFERLSALHCEIMHEQLRAERVTEELFSQMADLARECIVVKGLTVYFATRNPFRIKNSSDRDVILPDSSVALELLERLSLEEYKPPVQHEELNLIFREHCFDFHKHFPVWTRKGGAVPAGIESEAREIRHTANVRISAIDYRDIADSAIRRTTTGGMTVCTPMPAVAAFIQIVHFFRDLIRLSVISLRHRPRVRLQELLDIRDLLRSPDFDKTHFCDLVAKYGAEDQVRLSGSFILACIGDSVLLDISGARAEFEHLDEPATFVLDVWHGFSFAFVRRPSEFLFAKILAPSVVAEVGPNQLGATAGGSTLALNDGHSIVHTHGRIRDFVVSFSIRADAHIDIRFFAEEDCSGAFCAFICIGMQFFHFNFHGQEERHRVSASYGSDVISQKWHVVDGHHEVSLRLSFDPDQQEADRIESLVCVGSLRSDGVLEAGAMAAVYLDLPVDAGAGR